MSWWVHSDGVAVMDSEGDYRVLWVIGRNRGFRVILIHD